MEPCVLKLSEYMMMLLEALSKQLLSFAQLSEGSMDGYGQADLSCLSLGQGAT